MGDEFTCFSQINVQVHEIGNNNPNKMNVACVGNNMHGQIDVDTAIAILHQKLNLVEDKD